MYDLDIIDTKKTSHSTEKKPTNENNKYMVNEAHSKMRSPEIARSCFILLIRNNFFKPKGSPVSLFIKH